MKVTVSFYLTQREATAPTPIFARISFGGNKLKYYPAMTIKPSEWNIDAQRMTESKKITGYKKFNGKLTDIENYATEYINIYFEKNSSNPSTDDIKKYLDNKLKGISDKKIRHTFLSFFQKFIDDSKNGLRIDVKGNKPITKGTIKNYTGTKNTLTDFIAAKKRKVDFDNIDLDFYADFTTYLQKDKGMATNTVGKHIKIIKTLLNEATEDGINTNLAYKSKKFIPTQEKVDNIYLTENELEQLGKLDLSTEPKLDRVRDLFLVGCYTGLRFSDFSVLRPDQIQDGFIETTQIKTGDAVVIPIHNQVEQILKKYDGNPPPAISNQKMNEYIKLAAKKIDDLKKFTPITYHADGKRLIKNIQKYKLVSTHTARRSFATNEFKAGTPTITIMAITGHKTEAAFLKYIKVTPKEHAQILKLAWQDRRNSKLIPLSA